MTLALYFSFFCWLAAFTIVYDGTRPVSGLYWASVVIIIIIIIIIIFIIMGRPNESRCLFFIFLLVRAILFGLCWTAACFRRILSLCRHHRVWSFWRQIWFQIFSARFEMHQSAVGFVYQWACHIFCFSSPMSVVWGGTKTKWIQ